MLHLSEVRVGSGAGAGRRKVFAAGLWLLFWGAVIMMRRGGGGAMAGKVRLQKLEGGSVPPRGATTPAARAACHHPPS